MLYITKNSTDYVERIGETYDIKQAININEDLVIVLPRALVTDKPIYARSITAVCGYEDEKTIDYSVESTANIVAAESITVVGTLYCSNISSGGSVSVTSGIHVKDSLVADVAVVARSIEAGSIRGGFVRVEKHIDAPYINVDEVICEGNIKACGHIVSLGIVSADGDIRGGTVEANDNIYSGGVIALTGNCASRNGNVIVKYGARIKGDLGCRSAFANVEDDKVDSPKIECGSAHVATGNYGIDIKNPADIRVDL